MELLKRIILCFLVLVIFASYGCAPYQAKAINNVDPASTSESKADQINGGGKALSSDEW